MKFKLFIPIRLGKNSCHMFESKSFSPNYSQTELQKYLLQFIEPSILHNFVGTEQSFWNINRNLDRNTRRRTESEI